MKRDDLVKRIKEICISKGISVRQMEEDLDFSPGLISRWVRMSPSIEKITAVADYLDVSLDTLVGRKQEAVSEDLVDCLYKKTKEKKISWGPCGFVNPFIYPISKLRELQNINWECGYCEYANGYFLLACALDEEGNLEDIGIYILTDEEAAPVRWDADGDELLELYDLIQEDIIWKEDRKQAEVFKDSFMNDRQM